MLHVEFPNSLSYELLYKGYCCFTLNCINYMDSLLRLGRTLGTVKSSWRQDGPIEYLRATDTENAKPNSHSSRFGKGAFPLHTDDATSERPPKYLILFNLDGGENATTNLVDFTHVIASLDASAKGELDEAVFYFHTGRRSFLGTIRDHTHQWIRFDPNIMRPTGPRAAQLWAKVTHEIKHAHVTTLTWSQNRALVIDNHRMLHGRGAMLGSHPAPRTLLRVLVEQPDAAPF